ncbi:MAG: DUF1893 domain-containing protein [Clostridiales bacterium]|jgi:hypothetical protein|nr:DUF1893 domain-containing protein [Clostridiales bacterium]
MDKDIDKAKLLLKGGKYTLALCKDDKVYTDDGRGLSALIRLIKTKFDLTGFSAADKVVGKAAAMLLVLCGVVEIYAATISKPAVAFLKENGVKYSYDTLTDEIMNATGTAPCPMEQAVKNISDPAAAFTAIEKTVERIKSKSTD